MAFISTGIDDKKKNHKSKRPLSTVSVPTRILLLNEFYSRARVFVVFIVNFFFCCLLKKKKLQPEIEKRMKKKMLLLPLKTIGISRGLFNATGRLHATTHMHTVITNCTKKKHTHTVRARAQLRSHKNIRCFECG